MDSFELNKIIGAVLGTLLFVMGVGFLAEAIYEPHGEHGIGYALPMPEGAADGEASGPVAEATPLPVLLAEASVEDGTAATRKCQACHTFEQGGANKQGPNLWGIVGGPIAHLEGFDYSSSLRAYHDAGETWTFEHLDAFLTRPKGFAADTKMTFGGVNSPEERADIIAFLRSLSDNPVPLPPVEEQPATDEVTEGTAPVEPAATTVVETPTTTQGETPVAGTPAQPGAETSETPSAEAPAGDAPAATPAPEAPAATETPAPLTQAPMATDAPAAETPAAQ